MLFEKLLLKPFTVTILKNSIGFYTFTLVLTAWASPHPLLHARDHNHGARGGNKETEYNILEKELADIKRRLNLAEKREWPTPDVLAELGDDDMPDPSILKLLKTANIGEDQASICGPPAGRSFEIRFKGCSAAINATRTFSAQRRAGEWTKLQCPAANGTETANLFVSPNKKNPKTERNQSLLRQLRKAVLTLYPALGGKLRIARSDGILFVDSDPVARALSLKPGEIYYNWWFTVCESHKIDKDAVFGKIAEYGKGRFADITWGLYTSRHYQRRDKIDYLRRLLKTNTAIFIAEAHCTVEAFQSLLPDVAREWWIAGAPGSRNSGSVIAMVRKYWTLAGTPPECDVLAEKRVVRILANAGKYTSTAWAVHNFNINDRDLANIKNLAIADTTSAEADPLSKPLGDWSFIDEDERVQVVRGPRARERHHCPQRVSIRKRLIDLYTAYDTPEATHLANGKYARLGRICSSTPSWAIGSAQVTITALDDPLRLRLQKISDHAAVAEIIRETGRVLRNRILKTAPDADLAQMLAMASLARAVRQGDCDLAKAVLTNFSKGRNFVSVDEGRVAPRDPPGFADAFDEDRAESLATAWAAHIGKQFTNGPATAEILKRRAVPLDWSLAPAPSTHLIKSSLKSASDSSLALGTPRGTLEFFPVVYHLNAAFMFGAFAHLFIPLFAALAAQMVEPIGDQLQALVPEWVQLAIVRVASYLGYLMGPNVADEMRGEPTRKQQQQRADARAEAKGPTTATIKEYNIKAVPYTLHVAQFEFPPRALVLAETGVINKLWHVPPSTFTTRGMFRASEFGAVDVVSVSLACVAALIRAALIAHDWETPLAEARLRRRWPEQASDTNGVDFDAFIAIMRMRESAVHLCLFGCTAKDEWPHYADCLPLWSTVRSALGAAHPARRFDCIGLHAKRPDDLYPLLTAGPRWAIPARELAGTDQTGFPVQFRFVCLENQAAMYRVGLRSVIFPGIYHRWRELRDYQVDRRVVPRRLDWVQESIASPLCSVRERSQSAPPTPSDPDEARLRKKILERLEFRDSRSCPSASVALMPSVKKFRAVRRWMSEARAAWSAINAGLTSAPTWAAVAGPIAVAELTLQRIGWNFVAAYAFVDVRGRGAVSESKQRGALQALWNGAMWTRAQRCRRGLTRDCQYQACGALVESDEPGCRSVWTACQPVVKNAQRAGVQTRRAAREAEDVEQSADLDLHLLQMAGNAWADFFATRAIVETCPGLGFERAIELKFAMAVKVTQFVAWAAARVSEVRAWSAPPDEPRASLPPAAPTAIAHIDVDGMACLTAGDAERTRVRCKRCRLQAYTDHLKRRLDTLPCRPSGLARARLRPLGEAAGPQQWMENCVYFAPAAMCAPQYALLFAHASAEYAASERCAGAADAAPQPPAPAAPRQPAASALGPRGRAAVGALLSGLAAGVARPPGKVARHGARQARSPSGAGRRRRPATALRQQLCASEEVPPPPADRGAEGGPPREEPPKGGLQEEKVLAELCPEQAEVARAVLAGGSVFITGEPGSGKSFLLERPLFTFLIAGGRLRRRAAGGCVRVNGRRGGAHRRLHAALVHELGARRDNAPPALPPQEVEEGDEARGRGHN
ncbi:unnamed protein product [Prorocentrum cordatum]|uniref:ATP-dependent DNA helicase n=1 Tax=Prorocentrum cordatum TaxID=2364126 RepID=A0ABN9TBN1_9DINO|nr:unnamed protein product [Polarella glacialis]